MVFAKMERERGATTTDLLAWTQARTLLHATCGNWIEACTIAEESALLLPDQAMLWASAASYAEQAGERARSLSLIAKARGAATWESDEDARNVCEAVARRMRSSSNSPAEDS